MSSKEVLDQAATAVRQMGAAEVASDALLADEVAALRQLADVAEAAYVSRLAMFDSRGVSEIQEVLTTRQWARHHFQVAAGETARVLKIGKVVATLPVVEAALLAGSIRMPHAAAIADAVALVGLDVIAGCQDALVKAAQVNDPARLRAALRGLGLAIDSKNDRKRAERQHQDRWLDVATTFEGAVAVEGMLDAEAGAIVQAAVEAASKPSGVDDRRTASQRRADALVDICRGLVRTPQASTPAEDDTSATNGHGTGGYEGVEREASGDAADDDDDAAAACDRASDDAETAQASGGTGVDVNGATGAFGHDLGNEAEQSTGGRSGCVCGGRGARPSIMVVCDLATLTGTAGGYGELPNGQILTGDAVRRLACDASITRIITGPGSQPLDVGRAQRTVTTAQLKALRIRDGGCRFPGCERPIEWCDVHHVIWWANGGRTDIANLILLCRKHHTAVHEGGWAIHVTDSGEFAFLDRDGVIVGDQAARATRPLVDQLVTSSTGNP